MTYHFLKSPGLEWRRREGTIWAVASLGLAMAHGPKAESSPRWDRDLSAPWVAGRERHPGSNREPHKVAEQKNLALATGRGKKSRSTGKGKKVEDSRVKDISKLSTTREKRTSVPT